MPSGATRQASRRIKGVLRRSFDKTHGPPRDDLAAASRQIVPPKLQLARLRFRGPRAQVALATSAAATDGGDATRELQGAEEAGLVCLREGWWVWVLAGHVLPTQMRWC